MIRFLVARGCEFVVHKLVRGHMGGDLSSAVLTYDRLFASSRIPAGVYIFCDLERLNPWELRLAAEAYRLISADPRGHALNNPARAMTRYELLRRLYLEGINGYEVFRADELRIPPRFPVFLRFEQDHGQPLSDLLFTPEALDQALRRLRDEGIPPRGVLVTEYAAESFAPPLFRKFSTFRVGDSVFAHHIVTENSWSVKYGMSREGFPKEYDQYEADFVAENRYADLLRRVFEIAAIDYGRADYGLVAGRVQVYEINTNPFLGDDPHTQADIRCRTIALSTQKLLDSVAALDSLPASGSIPLRGPLLDAWRADHKWYERPEKRP